MAFAAMALLIALFWLVAEAATIWRIMSGEMPPFERSCAEPVKATARPIARARVVTLFIKSCKMIVHEALSPRARLIVSLASKVQKMLRPSKKSMPFSCILLQRHS